MENSESKKGRTLSIAFIVVLVAVALFTVIGMIAMRHQPLVLQGQGRSYRDSHQRQTAGTHRHLPG